MNEVKWIKLSIDTFNDEKVQLLESLPEGPSVLLIWMKLLCLAGKVNDGGYVYVGQNLPYTDEMLATIFRQPVNTIRLALSTFERFEMIEINEHGIYISNWSKHQNVEGMERQKELNRIRVAKFRDKQKELPPPPADVMQCNVTDHYSNAPRKKKEDSREKNNTTPTPSKTKYADRVTMLESEYANLVQELGKEGADRCIEILDTYKGANGKQYKSDYLAIKNWVIQRYMEDKAKAVKAGVAVPTLTPTVKRYKAIRRVKDGQGRTMMQSSPGFFMTEEQAREWAGPDGDVNEADIPIDYNNKPQDSPMDSIRNLAAGMKVN